MSKIAVVTGASSGIGYELANRYLENNIKVVGIDRSESKIENELYTHIATDISNYDQLKASIDSLNLEKIDYLVNCAGITFVGDIENTSPADFDLQIDVNLKGTFNMCKICIDYMKDSGNGAIVNIASDLAVKPVAERTAYCAVKAAVIALTESLAIDYAPHVRANVVLPGIVDTPMVQGRFEENPELRSIYGSFYLLDRIAKPSEIVDAIEFLTSDKSSFITGISLPVAGGSNLK